MRALCHWSKRFLIGFFLVTWVLMVALIVWSYRPIMAMRVLPAWHKWQGEKQVSLLDAPVSTRLADPPPVSLEADIYRVSVQGYPTRLFEFVDRQLSGNVEERQFFLDVIEVAPGHYVPEFVFSRWFADSKQENTKAVLIDMPTRVRRLDQNKLAQQ